MYDVRNVYTVNKDGLNHILYLYKRESIYVSCLCLHRESKRTVSWINGIRAQAGDSMCHVC